MPTPDPGAGPRDPNASGQPRLRSKTLKRGDVAITRSAWGPMVFGGGVSELYFRVPNPSSLNAMVDLSKFDYEPDDNDLERLEAIRVRVAKQMFVERYRSR